MSRRWLVGLVPLVLVAVSATPAPAAPTPARGGFPNGVAAGEVTETTAVFWTRTDRPAAVKLEVSRDQSFRGSDVFHRTIHTAASDEFTADVQATGLSPATTYFFRWRYGPETASRVRSARRPPRAGPPTFGSPTPAIPMARSSAASLRSTTSRSSMRSAPRIRTSGSTWATPSTETRACGRPGPP